MEKLWLHPVIHTETAIYNNYRSCLDECSTLEWKTHVSNGNQRFNPAVDLCGKHTSTHTSFHALVPKTVIPACQEPSDILLLQCWIHLITRERFHFFVFNIQFNKPDTVLVNNCVVHAIQCNAHLAFVSCIHCHCFIIMYNTTARCNEISEIFVKLKSFSVAQAWLICTSLFHSAGYLLCHTVRWRTK